MLWSCRLYTQVPILSCLGHPSSPPASIGRGLLKHAGSIQRAFSLEYRLSRGAPYEARNSFPAALLDALACYQYLVKTVGFAPEDIILEGALYFYHHCSAFLNPIQAILLEETWFVLMIVNRARR